MNTASWFSLGLVSVIFISSQTVDGQIVGSRSTSKYRRVTNTTACKEIKFKKRTDACSLEIGTDKYPILGSCTTYYQCLFTGSIFLPVADTNCDTGEVFHFITKECQPGNSTAICKQIKCLKDFMEFSDNIDSASKNETEKPNISTIPDEKLEKETELIQSTHNNQTHGHQKESKKNHDASSGDHFQMGFRVFFIGLISSVLSRFFILSP